MCMKPAIRPLDSRSAQRLSSDQVIRDLGSAVKELVENSLDACAHTVEVRFRNHGLDLVEVIDDGNGIAAEDIEQIGKRHYTSKLRQFADLDQVRSFGFRGEALASLCAVSGRVQLVTATPADAPCGTRVVYDHQGRIVERSSVARTSGTTVSVEGLLSRLPVRRAEFKRNAKREFARAFRWLQSYALSNNINSSRTSDNPITTLVRQRQMLQKEAGLSSDASTAEQALSRVVTKGDFYRMEILGQFNHGFILVLLPHTTLPQEGIGALERRKQGDLFIIDQHAADEKWWYETLIAQPQDRPQPLLRPRPLHVGESERVAIMEHLEVFQRNGYTIEVNDHGTPMMVAQPVGADAMKDIEELAIRIQEGDDLRTLRPSRFLAQCASKACRTAVMIGDPLSKPQMERIVRQLGELHHPWNCPHGRPTMRHLADMSLFEQ
ncbi:histidine kinase-like ATPase [Syncephalis pseudoplumigaleata]|uniref:Histidine kinase-like ATPase n=1 Tax=Syncephalis pseudoplumigaleata TaxID=1712513 RepID=A0A4V1J194_9FUNG|nr:histidine kinase-like ATPase [Syncephalis pseudoplumigaleata]|eukprot:RKP24269.1 histidine kinase-like ATPase [Syncephalis pseudoplumigaleata]